MYILIRLPFAIFLVRSQCQGRKPMVFFLFSFAIAVFSLSTYLCTPSGRRTAISPRNPFARASVFWHNRKRILGKRCFCASFFSLCYFVGKVKVENLRVSFYFVFYPRFLPLGVPLYAFGKKNEDFCLKSLCRGFGISV